MNLMHCVTFLFAPHAFNILIVVILCIYSRSHKAEDGNPSGASPMGVGDPQATSYEDANIVVIKASPSASHQSSCLLYLNLIYNTIYLCIKFIGVG
jgi:hypothetical protein